LQHHTSKETCKKENRYIYTIKEFVISIFMLIQNMSEIPSQHTK
jgi:hypothetical protein